MLWQNIPVQVLLPFKDTRIQVTHFGLRAHWHRVAVICQGYWDLCHWDFWSHEGNFFYGGLEIIVGKSFKSTLPSPLNGNHVQVIQEGSSINPFKIYNILKAFNLIFFFCTSILFAFIILKWQQNSQQDSQNLCKLNKPCASPTPFTLLRREK